MRINQYIAQKQNLSRREADKLIADGKVRINNRAAVLGDKVKEDDDVVINGKSLKNAKKEFVYLIFNKPKGIVSHKVFKGQKSIKDILKYPVPIFPVGRLDKDSSGLIFLTNDGRIVLKMLHPKYFHEKEYVVSLNKPITKEFSSQMSKGINIGGYTTKTCRISRIDNKKFKIILTEGKKRQIRRMCLALGYQVTDLVRIRIMNLKLENLKPGEYKKVEGKELKEFLEKLNV